MKKIKSIFEAKQYTTSDLEKMSSKELSDLYDKTKEEFHKTLDPNLKSLLHNIETVRRGFEVDTSNRKLTFKKSKRVTPFTRHRT